MAFNSIHELFCRCVLSFLCLVINVRISLVGHTRDVFVPGLNRTAGDGRSTHGRGGSLRGSFSKQRKRPIRQFSCNKN